MTRFIDSVAPVIPNAVMLDKVLGEVQSGLVSNLTWLDVAFGKAQKLTKISPNKKTVITPNVYCGGWKGHGKNDYIEVSPDSKIGNFSFFLINDPQEISPNVWNRHYTTPFSLIFWFDLRKVWNSQTNRDTEHLKAQIIQVVNGRKGWTLKEGRIEINRCYEQPENIYRGFTLSEIDNQFLMHPYAGFRFDGVLEYDELCTIDDGNS